MLTTNQLVLDHMYFADSIAKSQFRKTPHQIQLDELKSAAYMGLVDAATRYDGKRDFKTFASKRIAGEIQDYLRELCWFTKPHEFEPFVQDIAEEIELDDFDDFLEDLGKNKITSFAKNILKMYYKQDLNLEEIGHKVNLCSARISQLIKENLEILKTNGN